MAEKSIKNHDILTTYTNKLWKICLINTLKVPNKHSYMLIYSHCFLHYYQVNTVRHIHKCADLHPCSGLHWYRFFFFFFFTFATLYHYSSPHFYLELWRNVKQYVQQNVPTKLNLNAICLIKKNFSLQLDYKVYKTKTKLDSISICIEKKSLHYLYCNWTHSLDMTSWPMKFKLNFVNPHLRLL